ncbi:hypothetical protein [Caulobacter sp. 602-1]|uniref:hypothetical protein n=1 Tax=unclassified Caulobacter TaxID=2648921 RepID=UPI000F6421ED|nr:hypothetical protein [Caulobacter sp. 602-1]RRN63033.1 hypothetical protein EIK80_18000 [Caulobacter sp. 602-1]
MTKLLLAAAIALAAAPAFAAEPAEPAVIAALKACRAITADAERLACYDKAAQSVTKAQETGEVIIIDKQAARAARRQAFGLELPTLSILDKGADKAETDKLQSVVKSARVDGEQRLVVTLEDGAVWRQIDDTMLGKPPKAGDTIEVRKAAMGSYMMKIGSQPAIRVRRIEVGGR